MLDKQILYDAIVGGNDELFKVIWPVYKNFLESTHVAQRQAYYLDAPDVLIDDFYRWLSETKQLDTLRLIDRRKSADRRESAREGSPGRRKSDFDNP